MHVLSQPNDESVDESRAWVHPDVLQKSFSFLPHDHKRSMWTRPLPFETQTLTVMATVCLPGHKPIYGPYKTSRLGREEQWNGLRDRVYTTEECRIASWHYTVFLLFDHQILRLGPMIAARSHSLLLVFCINCRSPTPGAEGQGQVRLCRFRHLAGYLFEQRRINIVYEWCTKLVASQNVTYAKDYMPNCRLNSSRTLFLNQLLAGPSVLHWSLTTECG